jgi:hypothetical protein
MTEQLLVLGAGFLLTTLVGTWWQHRFWVNQHRRRLADEELRRAEEVAQSLSNLMDMRLYRMLRLFYSLRARALARDGAKRQLTSEETISSRLADYDTALFAWNDRMNFNLALIGTYFGDGARDWLGARVYLAFQELGAALEALLHVQQREDTDGTATEDLIHQLEAQFTQLNDDAYALGLFMSTLLREGRVGRAAPRPIETTERPEREGSAAVPLAGLDARGTEPNNP